MNPVKLPKEVLNLFPMWEYRCPCCGTYIESDKAFCPKCKTAFDEKKWRVAPRFLKSYDAMSYYAHKVLAPKLSSEQRKLLFKYFTELFSDGFESGDFSEWTGTATAINGTNNVVDYWAHHGTHSYECDMPSGYDKAYIWRDLSGTSQENIRFYIKITGASFSDGDKFSIVSTHRVGNFKIAEIGIINSTRQLYLTYQDNSFSSPTNTSSTTLELDTEYCIELEVIAEDNTHGTWRVYVDGTEIADITVENSLFNYMYGYANRVIFGTNNYSGTPTATFLFDCVVVADTYTGPETTEQTYTKTWSTDALFKKLGISKALSVDTSFQKQDVPKTFDVDAALQKRAIIQKQIDALFKRLDRLESFTVDACFGALLTQTMSRQIDVVFKKLDATKAFGLDVYFGPVATEAYVETFALDVMFAYKVRLPELWLDENGKMVLNISKPYTWVGS
ncbi:MAG: hypothetical protein CW691_07355 [Candidatus Bathyarchaeum sp.]|nr:MAG: hypothetical protein CW691_07355 [Candidatus Bathyarchaeum sp.]